MYVSSTLFTSLATMLTDSILMILKGSLIMVVVYISLMIINVMHFVGGPEDHHQAQ